MVLLERESVPKAELLYPVMLEKRASAPKAELRLARKLPASLLLRRAFVPKAEFWKPATLLLRASVPKAELAKPPSLALRARAPKAELPSAVVLAFNAVEFHKPVHVGDVVSLWAEATRCGRTSLHVHVDVRVQRAEAPDESSVTNADVVLVAIDTDGAPQPIFPPGSEPSP